MSDDMISRDAAYAAVQALIKDATIIGQRTMISHALTAIRAQPHDHSALDAAIRAAKVEAWRKAEVAILGLATGRECQTTIRALIEREATK